MPQQHGHFKMHASTDDQIDVPWDTSDIGSEAPPRQMMQMSRKPFWFHEKSNRGSAIGCEATREARYAGSCNNATPQSNGQSGCSSCSPVRELRVPDEQRPTPPRSSALVTLFAGSARRHLPQARPRGYDRPGGTLLPCGLHQDDVIQLMYRELSPEDFELLCKLDEMLPKRNIARENFVALLPRASAGDCNCIECGVCLAELEPSTVVIRLPCRHSYHPHCISRWLTQCKNSCPLCFVAIDQNQEPHSI